jgi:Fur family ferric uptake transcriptional regulator
VTGADMDKIGLKEAGLKVTLPRMKILEILENSENQHLTAEDIYKILLQTGDDIGVATIYRVLSQFESASLVNRHQFETGQAVFELNRGHHHDHLICVKCGKIVEFVDDEIEKRQEDIAEKEGFQITDHALIIYGICSNNNCN